MAMGARSSHVLKLVIGDGMKPVIAGRLLGLLGVLGLNEWWASLVFEVSASDPVTLAGVTLTFGCVSLAALYFPARRATRIDPLVILRADGRVSRSPSRSPRRLSMMRVRTWRSRLAPSSP